VDVLINAGLSRVPPNDGFDRRAKRRHQGSVAEHRKLLHSTRGVLHDILEDTRIGDNTSLVLVHPDLHTSNIFVDPDDPTKITSIINWQSASIGPVFMCPLPVLNFALPPGYLAYIEEKERYSEMTTTQIWNTTLEASLHKSPRLHSLISLDMGFLRLFKICHRTWRDGTPLLTSDLIDVAENWQELELPGSCRYTPLTGSELDAHKTRWAWFEDFQRFREYMSEELQASGDSRVPVENWDAVQELYRVSFDHSLELTKEPNADMTERDWRAIWPYDVPY
jgi:hypothetical protein